MPDVPADLTSADPAELARLVGSLSAAKLDEVMRGELRGRILAEIFRRMSEHFEPEKAKGLDAVVDFKITGRPDGGFDHYQAVIRDGVCVATALSAEGVSANVSASVPDAAPPRAPRTTIRADAGPFLRLVTGAASGFELLMTGRLKVEGDLLFAARVGSLFSVPRT